MTKIYSPEELDRFSRETLVAVILSMQDQLAEITVYDVSLYNGSKEHSERPVMEILQEHGFDLAGYLDGSVTFAYHDTGIHKADLLAGCYEGDDVPGTNITVDAVSESDYNALMELSGQPTFDLPEGRELLHKWGVEGDWEGVGYCILGYPDGEAPAPAVRKEGYVKIIK